MSVERYYVGDRVVAWLDTPVPVLRLEIPRIFAPLFVLGFFSSRLAHADEWLGDTGFRIPHFPASDYRQPFYVPGLPEPAAWAVAVALVLSGLAVSLGYRARRFAMLFAVLTIWVALADRLSAFSVSKLAPMIALALAASPCGRRLSIDAWNAKRRRPNKKLPTTVTSGTVRFFQVFLPVVYSASGIAKLHGRGDWLKDPYSLWSHLHDTYQTSFTVFVANAAPTFAWPLLQGFTLIFECGSPVWFAWGKARIPALIWGVSMHAMIGLMFGPVRWFAMLMATILLASYLPDRMLDRLAARSRSA